MDAFQAIRLFDAARNARIPCISRQCQKSHWPAHKRVCVSLEIGAEVLEHRSWQAAERIRTLRKWTEEHGTEIIHAAGQALRLWESLDLIANTAFLVYLNVEEYVESDAERKIVFLRTVRDAKCVPMVEVHAKYDSLFAKMPVAARNAMTGYEALEEAFNRRPGMLRIATIDECPLGSRGPYLTTLPAVVDAQGPSLIRAQMPLDGDWLKQLRQRLAASDNASKLAAKKAAFLRWSDTEKIQRHIRDAGVHALDLRKQPSRADVDVFFVSLDCQEEIVSAIRRLSNFSFTVRKAYAIPANQLDEKSANVLEMLPGATSPEAGERLLRVLLVEDNSEDFPTILAPLEFVIPAKKIFPSFDPEWLSILKENARL
ncbi:hypothetical protein HWV62_10683 [Athelia sp. TMB]|nr:hypothetical protein HWV62_10683 [Athelia sp. TMB]